MKRIINRVLLIDIPTYKVSLPEKHRRLVSDRWRVQSMLWERRVGRKMIRPGLSYSRGMLIIAACLEQEGFDTAYLNYTDPIDRSHISHMLQEIDAVCITVLTPTFHVAIQLCDKIKLINQNLIIIIGGPHVSARPIDSLRNFPMADFAMIGECDLRLPALLKAIDSPDSIAGTVYRDKDTIQISAKQIDQVTVSELPLPAYHLLNRPLSQYAHNIQTARGCPFECKFCVDRLTWHSTTKSLMMNKDIFREIELLSRHVHAGSLIHFSDAIFNLSYERVVELVDRLKKADIDLCFSFDTRVDLINEKHVKLLSEAGFVYFRLGFESVRDNVLNNTGKGISYTSELEATRIIRSVSPTSAILAYIITGLPGSTKESIAEDAILYKEMIQKDHVDIIGNKILVPYPGTPYFDHAKSMNINIKTTDWSKYDRNSYPVYELKNLSSEEIYMGFLYQEAILTHAYMDKAKASQHTLQHINRGLDYAYESYASYEDMH